MDLSKKTQDGHVKKYLVRFEPSGLKIEVSGGTAQASMTFRVSDEGWERLLPVRLDLEKHGDRWVLVGLHLFD